MTGDYFIYALLIVQKIAPLVLAQPGFLAIGSQTRVAFGQGLGQLLLQDTHRLGQIQNPVVEIPLRIRNNLDVARSQAPGRLRQHPLQGFSGLCLVDGIGNDPQAKFICVQSGLEIGNQNIEQVLRRFIEITEVRAPRNRPHGGDSGLS